MGRFTGWLDQIGGATRQVISESGEAICLPKELGPLQEDLKAIQTQLTRREEAARESEQRKQDLIAFLAHDLKTPHLRGGVSDPPAGQARYGQRPARQVHRHRPGQGGAAGGAAGEFFDITRMDLKSMEKDMTPIQLTVLLEQLADEFYPFCGEGPDLQRPILSTICPSAEIRTSWPGSSTTCCETR